MPDYQRGKVYQIVCRKSGLKYIGSTSVKYLSQRLALHVHNFRHKVYGCCTSAKVLEGGDYFIEILEECPCTEKSQLLARERYFIENTECVNKNIAGRSHAESMRAWQIKNRDYWNAYMRAYTQRKRDAAKAALAQ